MKRSRNAGQRRHHPTAPEAPGRPSPCEDDRTGWQASDDWSLAERAGLTGPLLSTWSGVKVVDVLQDIAQPPGQPGGSVNTPKVEFVSRDRCGLYAQRAHEEGAPQAQQVAGQIPSPAELARDDRDTAEPR